MFSILSSKTENLPFARWLKAENLDERVERWHLRYLRSGKRQFDLHFTRTLKQPYISKRRLGGRQPGSRRGCCAERIFGFARSLPCFTGLWICQPEEAACNVLSFSKYQRVSGMSDRCSDQQHHLLWSQNPFFILYPKRRPEKNADQTKLVLSVVLFLMLSRTAALRFRILDSS